MMPCVTLNSSGKKDWPFNFVSKIIFRSIFLVAQFFIFYQYFIKATTADIDMLWKFS